MSKQTIHIIAGPTAGGKSARALALAQEKNGIVINCDSLQIYDGLPLLTAQPAPAEMQGVPHALYSHLHPHDLTSAGDWREMVLPVIKNALAQGQTPIICGGTGLYIKALVEGLSPMPDVPAEVRNRVIAQYEALGAQEFYKALTARDPVMASRFHVNHKARLMRAMEVLEATGKSLAEWQALEREKPPEDWVFEIEIIIPEREELYRRCNLRFEAMIAAGALDEVRVFVARIEKGELREGNALTRALGFKELRAYLDGTLPLEDAITLAQTETRHYAKRQSTWFRNQM